MHILIVDDDPIALDVLRNALVYFGYQVTTAQNGREALELMRDGFYSMVISDWEMPEMDGLELCRRIRNRYSGRYIYIILLTVHTGTQNIIDGLNAGADEFLSKPFDSQELCVRVRAGERILSIESRDVTILSLAKLAEARDQETGAHVDRMREYCKVLAEHLLHMEKYKDQVDIDFVQLIYMTAPLHDIGKVGIPDRILLKPGPLTEEEFEVMKQHAAAGGMTLDSAISVHPEAKFLCMARDIAWTHHERYDGSGYPYGLIGDAIPLAGRIAGFADVYDALTTKRVYKPAYSHQKAREILLGEMASQFDPDIVEAFLENENQFKEIHERYAVREEKESRHMTSFADMAMSY